LQEHILAIGRRARELDGALYAFGYERVRRIARRLATWIRFAVRPGSKGSSRSTSGTRTSLPRSSPNSRGFARRSEVTEPFDVVAALPPDTDPAPYRSVGATWWMVEFPWDEVSSVDQVRGVIREGSTPAVA